jgi:hypothetical protein
MFLAEVDKPKAWYRRFSSKCPLSFLLMDPTVCSAFGVKWIGVQLYLPPPCRSFNESVPIISRIVGVEELELLNL